MELFPDLPNFWLNGATIPPDILQTGSRPYLVFIKRAKRKICFLELTCSLECNILMAIIQKDKKYNDFKIDLEKEGWNVALNPFNIRSQGFVTKQT